MLKFHSNSTTFISDFEEFFIFIYVLVDDLYQRYVPDSVSRRRNIDHSKTTDSEIITISLCGEIAGIDSQNARYAFVKKNYALLFPTLCSRTRFHRTFLSDGVSLDATYRYCASKKETITLIYQLFHFLFSQ